ncbi:MAG TPA: transketolase [Ktedonobacteraceae bacterium]|jgi:transketolase
MMTLEQLRQQATRIREHILAMGAGPEGAHVGGALSAADLLTILYFQVLRLRPEDPAWDGRDYFILSKGHGGVGLYATLAERGFFPPAELATYAQAGRLAAHPLRSVPGVEFPTGSLGHGLSLGLGRALAARRDGRGNRTYVLLGDGELQEGSIWEAAMAAAHFQLDNLVAIVDRNQLQITGLTEQQIRLEPLGQRWDSFGWRVLEVDGHDLQALSKTFALLATHSGQPAVIIAHTVKGRGVRFLEQHKKSHYVSFSPRLYQRARTELRQGTMEEGRTR